MKLQKLLLWLVKSLLLLNGTEAGFSQTNFWEQTNGPFGGYVFSLVINPSGHIFAGTRGAGVFRSTDNGNNWMSTNTGFTNTRIFSFAVDSSGQFFAGTFDVGIYFYRLQADDFVQAKKLVLLK